MEIEAGMPLNRIGFVRPFGGRLDDESVGFELRHAIWIQIEGLAVQPLTSPSQIEPCRVAASRMVLH